MMAFTAKMDPPQSAQAVEVIPIKVVFVFLPQKIGQLISRDFFLGYDGIPVEAMQGLDLNEGHYGQGYHNGGSDINYDSEVPNPPQDNNQVAAWYDTDL